MPETNFDFILGSWSVRNRRLSDYEPEVTASWDQFDSFVEGGSILGGRGILDQYVFPDFPGHGLSHGLCLRLRDPRDRWHVWWTSSAQAPEIGEPVVGGFSYGEGHFAGKERIGSRVILVQTRYFEITSESFEWEQAFSFDEGQTFELNWTMSFKRLR